MRSGPESAFEAMVSAMKQAAQGRSLLIAAAEAEQMGLAEEEAGHLSQTRIWTGNVDGKTLRFRWRWYDQSGPFSNQPDMNVLSLELSQGGSILGVAEERYED